MKDSVNQETNKWLNLKHGNAIKIFPLLKISNERVLYEDFNKWKERMKKDNIPLIFEEAFKVKLKELEYYRNYNYSNEEVDAMIKKKTAKRLQLGTMDHISIRKHIHELECDLSEACNNYENTKSEAHLILAKEIEDKLIKLKEKQKLSLNEITNQGEILEDKE